METVIHHRHELVLYSLQNIEPIKVVMQYQSTSTKGTQHKNTISAHRYKKTANPLVYTNMG